MERILTPLQFEISCGLHEINECKLEFLKEEASNNSNGTIEATIAKSASKPLLFSDLEKYLILKIKKAGLRNDRVRSTVEAQKLYEQIPVQIRHSPKDINGFLSDKQGSHIVPYSVDKTKSADNIKWENAEGNKMRGNKIMTEREQKNIDASNAVQGVNAAFKRCMINGCSAFIAGAALESSKTLVDKGIAAWKNKDKFNMETVKTALKKGSKCGFWTGGTAIAVTALCTAVPPLGVALTAVATPLSLVGTVQITLDFGSIINKHYGYRRGAPCLDYEILHLFSLFVPSPLKEDDLKFEGNQLEFDCDDEMVLARIFCTIEIFAFVKSLVDNYKIAVNYLGSEEYEKKVYSNLVNRCSKLGTEKIIDELKGQHKVFVEKPYPNHYVLKQERNDV